MIGPATLFSQQLHKVKYRQPEESFDDYCVRYARTTADSERHFRHLLDGLRNQRILPGGRQQLAVGTPYQTTAFNCFVGGTISDDLRDILTEFTDGMATLRTGGGCGWDFGPIRPEGDAVRRLGPGAYASGPLGFMSIWNAGCGTILSAGMRQGAMMGVLPVTHPDIMKFIRAKRNTSSLTNFNISVAVSNSFMEALYADKLYDLVFGGRTYYSVRAVDVWAAIMESNWDWAEPGVLFMDTANAMNPLSYCEWLLATNPCAEQFLPPHGACLIGSANMVKYLVPSYAWATTDRRTGSVFGTDAQASVRRGYDLDLDLFAADVRAMVRAFDMVIDVTSYPLPAQEVEAKAKRRMGVGATGLANAIEVCGHPYGTPGYITMQDKVLEVLRDTAYNTSCDLAVEKGSFPLFNAYKWLASGYARTLPDAIQARIKRDGLRNGMLLSMAPTGTISLTADNVSGSLEPPPCLQQTRRVRMPGGEIEVDLVDYALANYGVRCRTANEVSGQQHVEVLLAAQRYIDNSCSKTINCAGVVAGVPAATGEISFNEFKGLYVQAFEGGGRGCTTFNRNGKRRGIITEQVAPLATPSAETTGADNHDAACTYTSDGRKSCDS